MGINLPADTPGWLVLAVTIGLGLKLLGQFLSEASEPWAKVLGPLGRRWRARGEQRRRERADADTHQVSALTADRDAFEAMAARHQRRAEAAESEMGRFMDWYTQVDQPHHREVAVRAAEKGCEMPPWKPLSEWHQ
ncbi:hypothetical protein GCM10027289_29910 [Tsukamurella serpentis]